MMGDLSDKNSLNTTFIACDEENPFERDMQEMERDSEDAFFEDDEEEEQELTLALEQELYRVLEEKLAWLDTLPEPEPVPMQRMIPGGAVSASCFPVSFPQ